MAIPVYIKQIVEEIARLARSSPHVNQQSGVSVRMSIANLENVVSNAERRAIVHHEPWVVPRVSDLLCRRQLTRQARTEHVGRRRTRRQADPSHH